MTWLAQVGHIILKDIRQARILLALNVAVVALATAHALGMPMLTNGIFELSSLFVVASGMLLAGAVVQADSPTQSDAFWTSRPFYPSAMLASKLIVTLLLVIGIGVIGECAALRALDVPISDSLIVIAKAVEIYAIWLMIALVAAAVTRDLRTFIVVLMFAGFALIVGLSATLTGQQLDLIGPMRLALTSLGLIGSVALLTHLYHTHDTRRRIWLAGIVLAICLLTPVVFPPSPSDAIGMDSDRKIGVRIELMKSNLLAPAAQLTIRWHGDSIRPSERFVFNVQQAHVYPHGGNRLSVSVNLFSGGLISRIQPETKEIRWLDEREIVGASADIVLPLNARAIEAIAVGIDSVTVDGTMDVQGRIHDALPLQENAKLLSYGKSLSIVKVSRQPSAIALELHTISVGGNRNPMPLSFNFDEYGIDVALVNDSRREAIALHAGGTVTTSGSFVLPGAGRTQTVSQYNLGPYSGDLQKPFGVDTAWTRAARVEITQWTLKGRYSVHASSGVR